MYHFTNVVHAEEPAAAQCPFYTFLSNFLSALLVTAPFWYGFRNQLLHYFKSGEEDSSGDSSDESEEEEKDDYSMNYRTEYELLEDRVLSETELAQLHYKVVTETTDFGDVHMLYDAKTETFWYYTDHLKEVSYTLLEAVARKYVVEYKCKRLYLGGLVAEQQQEDGQKGGRATEGGLACEAGGGVAPHPYAKFKKYNTGKAATLNFTTGVDVIEQTNHFRYKGRLRECKLAEPKLAEHKLAEPKLAESETNVNKHPGFTPSMTYAEFKKLLEDTKKEN
jgi:hypothetical protein